MRIHSRTPFALRALASFAVCTIATFAVAAADAPPTIKGTVPPSTSEAAFVKAMQADLSQRFATAADAVKAGYVRYTDEDDTGAISYANLHWQSQDVHHPSQLWYDKAGRLLGADYSRAATSAKRPSLWGISPGRWYQFDEHIHFVTKDPASGAFGYDKYVLVPAYVGAGGDPKHPTAAPLVKLHKVKAASDVVTVFDFPAIWDLIVWVKPNPSGAFADKNPTVKP